MSKITKHTYPAGDRAAWLAMRNSFTDKIGGSELGAIAGHSKYSSFLRELEFAVGLNERPNTDNEAMRQGRDLEYYVAERFYEVSGKTGHVENCIFTNDACPHLKASIDRRIANERSGLECKTTQTLAMRRFKGGDFPLAYYDQICTYLAVTELDRWFLAILEFGNALHCYLVTRKREEADRYAELKSRFAFTPPPADAEDADYKEWLDDWAYLEAVYFVSDDEIAACETIAAHFFANVEAVKAAVAAQTFNTEQERKTALQNAIYQVVDPADIDGSKVTKDAVAALHAPVGEEEVTLVLGEDNALRAEVSALLAEREGIDARADALETRKAEIDNRLALVMSEADIMLCGDWKVSYKMSTPRKTASAAAIEAYFAAKHEEVPEGLVNLSTPSRSLRVSKPKPKKGKTKTAAA